MECVASSKNSDDKTATHSQSSDVNPPSSLPAEPPPPTELSPDSKKLGPAETAKRTKHTRVHKREKELCGLVTPIFLPLLEAGEASPTKKRKEKRRHKEEKAEEAGSGLPNLEQGSPSRDADKGKEHRGSRSKSREEKMERGESAVVSADGTKENQKSESGKKSKRSTVKKSSLRHEKTPKSRRKRVSLVIDDQIVLPADNVTEPLTSPSETTNSTASNSTASLDDMIDPRLVARHDTPVHQGPVHHSLPLSTGLPSTSPTKHTGHTLFDSPATHDHDSPQSPKGAPLEYEPPQTATRTFLDPSPPNNNLNIPQHASATPIYANEPEIVEEEEEQEVEDGDFETYVGGIDGSGLDNVNQSSSYGYPSSLGASYLESYMKSRPLSVRIAAAEKAELEESEKKKLIQDDQIREEDVDMGFGRVDDMDEGMEVIGSMEDF